MKHPRTRNRHQRIMRTPESSTKNGKMIPLDRAEVQLVLDDFSAWATSEAADYESGTTAFDAADSELERAHFISLQDVRGKPVPITIAFLPSDAFGGGYGRHPSLGAVVKVFYDARLSLAALGSATIQRRLRPILMHELTHALDWGTGTKGQAVRPEGPTRAEHLVDPVAYFNDPEEVRAHTRELYEEIRDEVCERMRGPLRTRWGLGKIVAVALQSSSHWKTMLLHLTPANRNRVLKKLTEALGECA